MDANLSRKLDEVNKLIFIREYHKADKLLAAILESRGDEDQALVIHLRRIELASKLSGIEKLRDEYLDKLRKKQISQKCGAICVALAEQQGELITAAESLQKFGDLIKQYGETAAAYFGLAFSLEGQGNTERAKFNYQQSIKIDSYWYPAYFNLSQIYYRSDAQQDGDHYFFLFEKFAPYNLYGNFETHKKLCSEFIQKEQYLEAEMAITLLGHWWVDHRGVSPVEVQVYEKLMLSSVAQMQKDSQKEQGNRQTALYLVAQACSDKHIGKETLYFLAKSLEEFGEEEAAFGCYRRLLKIAGSDEPLVQKIAQHFFTNHSDAGVAQTLFGEAYQTFPDLPHIRLCRLISNLKAAKVKVESYLLEKEKLLQDFSDFGPSQGLLPRLLKMLEAFDADPDIYAVLANVYRSGGNAAKTEQNLQQLVVCDPFSKVAALKLATFLSEQNRVEEAQIHMKSLHFDETMLPDQYFQLNWLQALNYSQKQDYEKALKVLDNVLRHDPWNVTYVSAQADWLFRKELPDLPAIPNPLQQQQQGFDVDDKTWREFAKQTADFAEERGLFSLVYARHKLSLLYAGGGQASMQQFVQIAALLDASKGRSELLFLLNTNFDSPWVLWGLGCLSKELWQLETASMWFETALQALNITTALRHDAYLELAECYVWTNRNLQKGIELVKLVEESPNQASSKVLTILAHAYLRQGQLREAQACLDQLPKGLHNFEGQYLAGLLQYRNGMTLEAKRLWKPLLTLGSENLRVHHIKQELLQYYFDSKNYLKAQ